MDHIHGYLCTAFCWSNSFSTAMKDIRFQPVKPLEGMERQTDFLIRPSPQDTFRLYPPGLISQLG